MSLDDCDLASESLPTSTPAPASARRSWRGSCRPPPPTRPAIARRSPTSPRSCWKDSGFDGRAPRRAGGATCARVGMISCTNLVVRRRFGDGPIVALNAHGDVVAARRRLDASALRRRGRRRLHVRARRRRLEVRLRHLCLRAAGARSRSPSGCKGSVELHFTFDEEIGGLIGPKWLLDQGIVKPDYCISAGLSYSVVTAHNGCLHLEVTVHGKSAHAAAPETGHDALAGDDARSCRRSTRSARTIRRASRRIPASAIRTSRSG